MPNIAASSATTHREERLARSLTRPFKAVAVVGTGVDVIYPRENSRLSEQILALAGALISEFSLGTFAAPQNFLIRNRILSGRSRGSWSKPPNTPVPASPLCMALEQNRGVFAFPGKVTNKNSWGPNTLIKQGAKRVATLGRRLG